MLAHRLTTYITCCSLILVILGLIGLALSSADLISSIYMDLQSNALGTLKKGLAVLFVSSLLLMFITRVNCSESNSANAQNEHFSELYKLNSQPSEQSKEPPLINSGVVVYFGDRQSDTGLFIRSSTGSELPLWEHLNNHVFNYSSEIARFRNSSISSIVLPNNSMSDLIVAVMRQVAVDQGVQFRVRTHEYINAWRTNPKRRVWD